ncbi:MAG: hypothetical protein CM1200mP30_03180 [Pseudomonadota bacterium]|nr:MAG: hypothetical protein CM1200mP30_03180 [Pseudomonadota bacterium]
MGKVGGGCNIFRDTIMSREPQILVCYQIPFLVTMVWGLTLHTSIWANVWGVEHNWIKSRFKDEKIMGKKGFTVARWYEGVLMDTKELGQDVNVHAAFYWGHSCNSQSQMDPIKTALDKVELLVDIDPFVTTTSILPDRKDGVYILPAATVYEQAGSVTNSNRDIQWRNRWGNLSGNHGKGLDIIPLPGRSSGFWQGIKKSKNGAWKELPEDITREWNLVCDHWNDWPNS